VLQTLLTICNRAHSVRVFKVFELFVTGVYASMQFVIPAVMPICLCVVFLCNFTKEIWYTFGTIVD
jgi:hypothetical protein